MKEFIQTQGTIITVFFLLIVIAVIACERRTVPRSCGEFHQVSSFWR